MVNPNYGKSRYSGLESPSWPCKDVSSSKPATDVGSPRRHRHGAEDGAGRLSDGQARGQHGGFILTDQAPVQASLDVLKLDPVEMTEEEDVDRVPPDVEPARDNPRDRPYEPVEQARAATTVVPPLPWPGIVCPGGFLRWTAVGGDGPRIKSGRRGMPATGNAGLPGGSAFRRRRCRRFGPAQGIQQDTE